MDFSALLHGMGYVFLCSRNIRAGGGGKQGEPAKLHKHLVLVPKTHSGSRAAFQRKFVFVLDSVMPHSAWNTRNFLEGGWGDGGGGVRVRLEILIRSTIFLRYSNFERIFWRARKTLMKHLKPIEHISDQIGLFIRDMDNLPQCLSYERPCYKHGTQWLLKEWRSFWKHASTTGGYDACQRSHTLYQLQTYIASYTTGREYRHERKVPPTIHNSPFHLTSLWVGRPRRQMEQTGWAFTLLPVLSRFRCGKQITWPGDVLKTERTFLLFDLHESWIKYEYT